MSVAALKKAAQQWMRKIIRSTLQSAPGTVLDTSDPGNLSLERRAVEQPIRAESKPAEKLSRAAALIEHRLLARSANGRRSR